MTPSTISSLIPAMSISFALDARSSSPSASGDGGGVCSYLTTGFGVRSRRNGGDIGAGDTDPCDRFIFFAGGCSETGVVAGGERVTGRWMPSDGRLRDFRRVLYPMFATFRFFFFAARDHAGFGCGRCDATDGETRTGSVVVATTGVCDSKELVCCSCTLDRRERDDGCRSL